MKNTPALFLILLFVIGCATSSTQLNKIHLGMSKTEVIQILGQPESTSAEGGVECLNYSLRDRVSKPGETLVPVSMESKYFVRFVDGKVDSYGRIGDYQTIKIER